MIIIHTVQGSVGSAEAVFQNPAAAASAHYIVGQDGRVVQMVEEHNVAWHAGNYPVNQRSIGIEHEGFVGYPYPGSQYGGSSQLSAYLVRKYHIPFDRSHIIGHNEVPDPYNPGQFGGYGHHTDPGTTWDWNYYMGLLAPQVGAPADSVAPLPATSNSTVVNVSWGPNPNSSGVSYYNIWVQDGGGPWAIWRPQTTLTSGPFHGSPGHTYSFWAQGVNSAGTNGAPQGPQTTVSIAAAAVSPNPFKGMYAVDGFGTLRPANSAPLSSPVWPGWNIARGFVLRADGHSGYTLDGWGGVHPFGGAPYVSITAYWSGWDIARSLVLRPDGVSGYVLDGWGGLHAFGGAPYVASPGIWYNWDIAKSLVLRPDGVSGYILDGWGGVHPFGGAPYVATSAYWAGWDIARSIVLLADGRSGYTLDGWGGIHPFGAAPNVASPGIWYNWDIARSATLLNPSLSSPSGYILDGWGGVHPFGAAPPVDTPYYSPALNNARMVALAP